MLPVPCQNSFIAILDEFGRIDRQIRNEHALDFQGFLRTFHVIVIGHGIALKVEEVLAVLNVK
jgi:hypothetical protein